jgi:hypothetical protein
VLRVDRGEAQLAHRGHDSVADAAPALDVLAVAAAWDHHGHDEGLAEARSQFASQAIHVMTTGLRRIGLGAGRARLYLIEVLGDGAEGILPEPRVDILAYHQRTPG